MFLSDTNQNDHCACDLLLSFKLLMSFPQYLQSTFTFFKWDMNSDVSYPCDWKVKPNLKSIFHILHISLYLWMRQGNDPVVICFPLIVKADGVYASLRVKCEDSIGSDISSSWWDQSDLVAFQLLEFHP